MLFKKNSQWGGTDASKLKDIFITTDFPKDLTNNKGTKASKKDVLIKTKLNKKKGSANESITSVPSTSFKKEKQKKQKSKTNNRPINLKRNDIGTPDLKRNVQTSTHIKKKKKKNNNLLTNTLSQPKTKAAIQSSSPKNQNKSLKRKAEDKSICNQAKRKKGGNKPEPMRSTQSPTNKGDKAKSNFNKLALVKVLNRKEEIASPKVSRAPPNLPPNLRELYDQALQKLEAGKFRYLNENLASSMDENDLSKFDFATFKDYHKGFAEQASKWEVNPIDEIIKILASRSSNLVIADFGCGEAKIAHKFPNRKVHSFDLHALNAKVTPCNIVDVPLRKGSVDICVYSLALMATDISEHIAEAYRVLRVGGSLIVAELSGRFEKLNLFLKNMGSYGFILEHKKPLSNIFILLQFSKKHTKTREDLPPLNLLPFVYKKR